jgi:hypothetical protein
MQGNEKRPNNREPNEAPSHWHRRSGLFIRQGERIVEAPPEDSTVAQGYETWPNKGPMSEGRRLTLMTKKTRYEVNEEIRVIHVAEVTKPGQQVYVMGPKRVYGEYLDGKLSTDSPPESEDPLMPPLYDGATIPSPAIDFNYEITSYSFSEPGYHQIRWAVGSLQSNILDLEIMDEPVEQDGASVSKGRL